MPLLKLKCPECMAGLKSATGFQVGQTVCCPKCETYFPVEAPEDEEGTGDPDETKVSKAKPAAPAKKTMKAAVVDDDEDEKPKKKKKKRTPEADEGGSYKNSPVRFIILGVLVLVMLGLGAALYLKKRNEAAAERARDAADAAEKAREQEQNSRPIGPRVDPKVTPKVDPKVTPKVDPNQPGKPGPVVGVAVNTLDGLLGGQPLRPQEAQALTQKYRAALIGTWVADLGNGVTEELTYKADGTFAAARAGGTPNPSSGNYTVGPLIGKKALRLHLTGAAGVRTITVVFEGNELLHPSLEPGVTGTFNKK
ncbi:MAG: hypothetical protein ACKODX_15825 [Gemmata sp.]